MDIHVNTTSLTRELVRFVYGAYNVPCFDELYVRMGFFICDVKRQECILILSRFLIVCLSFFCNVTEFRQRSKIYGFERAGSVLCLWR